jgi:hypothetical protein
MRDIKFPQPLTKVPGKNSEYWAVFPSGANFRIWSGSDTDLIYLNNLVVYNNENDALKPYVLVVANGVEYRWKPTLKEGHTHTWVYQIVLTDTFELLQAPSSKFSFGLMVHGSDDYEGALQHLAFLRATHEQK